MSEARVFLVGGFPKSGTTWMMRLLDHVPGVLCRGEGRLTSSHLIGVPSLAEALEEGLEHWLRFIAHRKRNWFGLDEAIETVECENLLPEGRVETLLAAEATRLAGMYARDLLRRAAEREGDVSLVGDKTPLLAAAELERLLDSLPDAPLVFLKRDPTDTIASLVHHFARSVRDGRPDARFDLLGPGDAARAHRHLAEGEGHAPLVSAETAATLAAAWRDTVDEAERRAATDPERVLVLQYEELFTRPEDALRRVLAHLGHPAGDTALAAAVAASSREAIAAGEEPALRAHVRDGTPGVARCDLDDEATAAIEAALRRPARS